MACTHPEKQTRQQVVYGVVGATFRQVRNLLLLVLLGMAVWAFGAEVKLGVSRASRPAAHLVALLNPGKRPEPVIVDAAHHRVYIGTETSGSVTVMDDRTNRVVKVIHVGREVEDLTLDRTSGMLYAVSSVASRLSAINTSALRVTAVIRHLSDASGVAVDPSRHRLYVTESNANAVAVIDTSSVRVIHTIKLPGDPQGIGVDTTLHRVFVGLFKLNRIAVIAESSGTSMGSVQVGTRPVHPFRVDPSAHRLYVVDSGSSTLSIIDTRSLHVVRTLRTGAHPEGLDVWPGKSRAYVSDEGDPGTDRNSGHTASVIDLRSGRIIDTVPTLQGPDGIAYDQTTGNIYVCNEDPGRVSVITLPSRDR